MHKKILTFLFVVVLLTISLSGCVVKPYTDQSDKDKNNPYTVANLAACSFAAEEVKQADTLSIKTEMQFQYGHQTWERVVLFEMEEKNGQMTAIMEFEENYEEFMLYYSNQTFYININNVKSIIPYDVDSLFAASYRDFICSGLLSDQYIREAELNAEDQNTLDVAFATNKLDSTMLETLVVVADFDSLVSMEMFITLDNGVLREVQAVIKGQIDHIDIVVDMKMTFHINEAITLLLPDLAQFIYHNGKVVNLPFKLAPVKEGVSNLTSQSYIQKSQTETYGQVFEEYAYIAQRNGNDSVSLYKVLKNGSKTQLLRENVDVIDSIMYTFSYSYISEKGDYIYFLGKGGCMYRMPKNGGAAEVLDAGSYDRIVVQDKWIFAENADGFFAVALDGTKRISLNNTGTSFSMHGRFLGLDRGYAYFYLTRWSDNDWIYMRADLNADDLVLEVIQLPFNAADRRLYAISNDYIYYENYVLYTPEDFDSKYYNITSKSTTSVDKTQDIGMGRFYSPYEFCMAGNFVLSYESAYDPTVYRYVAKISAYNLATKNRIDYSMTNNINAWYIKMRTDKIEIIGEYDDVYLVGADGWNAYYSL